MGDEQRKEKKKPTDSLGLVRDQKIKNKIKNKKQRTLSEFSIKKRPLIDDLFFYYMKFASSGLRVFGFYSTVLTSV